MRYPSVCAALLCLPVLVAQEGKDRRSAGRIVREELNAELQRQNRDYRAARKVVTDSEAYQEAAKVNDRAKLDALLAGVRQPDRVALAKQAVQRAAEFTGDDRVTLLAWAALKGGNAGIVKDVVAAVRKDHMQSPALVELLEGATVLAASVGAEQSAKFLSEVVAQSPHAVVRAWALYWQAVMLQRDPKASDATKAKANQLLADAETLAAGTELADRIAGPRFVEQHLQIGMPAPDIVGEDVDGTPFKLSDYLGKVVVLDFWGFW